MKLTNTQRRLMEPLLPKKEAFFEREDDDSFFCKRISLERFSDQNSSICMKRIMMGTAFTGSMACGLLVVFLIPNIAMWVREEDDDQSRYVHIITASFSCIILASIASWYRIRIAPKPTEPTFNFSTEYKF